MPNFMPNQENKDVDKKCREKECEIIQTMYIGLYTLVPDTEPLIPPMAQSS